MRRTVLVLMLLALCVPLAAAAAADAPSTAVAPAAAQAKPDQPAIGQADDGAQPPADSVGDADSSGEGVPFLNLETPKPQAVCKTGSCSSNSQCVEWYGPGFFCVTQQGQSCGWCIDF